MDIHGFIEQRPHLIWWTKDYARLSEESIVEAVLNYGDWDDVQELIRILGMKKTADIFREKSKPSAMNRQNYSPEARRFFTLYFNAHA